MQRKTRRMIVAIAVIALLAAGGAAFTAAIGGLDGLTTTAGFGSETIAGATATGVNYTLDSNGQYVDSVAVTLTGDYSSTDHPGYSFKASLMTSSGSVEATGVCTPDASYTAPSTNLACSFEGFSGTAGSTVSGTGTATSGVPVDASSGFDLSVTGNNGSDGTSETLG